MSENKELTGYPSIDKPWLKYYSKEAIEAELPEKTLWQYVYENNKDYPNDIAFRYFGTKITYGEFFENVKKAARSFVAMGIGEDDIVTIMSMHTPETIYSIYALNYIGAVANLVYMTLSPKEILYTVENTESKLLMVLDPALEKVAEVQKGLSVPIVVLSVSDSMPFHLKAGYRLKNKARLEGAEAYKMFLKHGENEPLPTEATCSETVAVIVYTSGTTGDPKGVMLSDNAINALTFQDMRGLFPFERRQSLLYILPPFVGFGITHIHITLCDGFEVILQIQLDPSVVVDALYKTRANMFIAGPAMIDAVMHPKYSKASLSNLRFFAGGGGEISRDKEAKLNDYLEKHKSLARYACGYGMTETGSILTANSNSVNKIGSAGVPFYLTNVKVVDTESGKLLTYGEEGELHFSTANMMLGYYHNQAATDEILYTDENGVQWIRTGDIGYVDDDGFGFITGRIKRIYISKSKDGFAHKLFPQRIEDLFQTAEKVEACGVLVREDVEKVNVAIAFVALKEGNCSQEEHDSIRANLFALAEQELPEHEQPVDIIILDSIPITPSGKIDYRKLEEWYEKNSASALLLE